MTKSAMSMPVQGMISHVCPEAKLKTILEQSWSRAIFGSFSPLKYCTWYLQHLTQTSAIKITVIFKKITNSDDNINLRFFASCFSHALSNYHVVYLLSPFNFLPIINLCAGLGRAVAGIGRYWVRSLGPLKWYYNCSPFDTRM